MHEWIVCDGCAVLKSPFMKAMGKSDHEHPLLHALFPVFQKRSSVSVVFDFNTSLSDAIPVYPILLTVDLMKMKKSGLLIDAICVLFLLCSLPRSSPLSVVFDFSASLSDAIPVSPILLTVVLIRMEKSGLLMDAICVLFLLSSPPISSPLSAVFDFNASLNDAAPVSPMLLSVD